MQSYDNTDLVNQVNQLVDKSWLKTQNLIVNRMHDKLEKYVNINSNHEIVLYILYK